MSTLRCFLCFELGSEIRRQLARVIAKLAPMTADPSGGPSSAIRWMEPQQMHLTVCYLGEVEWNQTHQITQLTQAAVSGLGPIQISCEGLGGFPNLQTPRVLWAGIRAWQVVNQSAESGVLETVGMNQAGDEAWPEPVLNCLHQRLVETFQDHQFFPDTKPLRPHVTLARLNKMTQVNKMSQVNNLNRRSSVIDGKSGSGGKSGVGGRSGSGGRSGQRSRFDGGDLMGETSRIDDPGAAHESVEKSRGWESILASCGLEAEFGLETVGELKLMSSEKSARGSIYHPIATVPLVGNRR